MRTRRRPPTTKSAWQRMLRGNEKVSVDQNGRWVVEMWAVGEVYRATVILSHLVSIKSSSHQAIKSSSHTASRTHLLLT